MRSTCLFVVAAVLMTAGLAQAQETTTGSIAGYVLAFVAPSGSGTGAFRHISVRVLFPPEVPARTRSGYFARRVT